MLASNSCVVASNGAFFEPMTLPVNGTYRIVIDPFGANTGTLTWSLYDVPADVTGSLTINGAPLPITIATPGQMATLTFDGTQNQTVRVPVTTPGSGCATVTLLRQDNSTVVASLYSCSSTFTLPSTSLPATETYRIGLDPYLAMTGNYSVQVLSP